MTLEERLADVLREWQRDAAKIASVIDTLHEQDEERGLLENDLARLNKCLNELAYAINGERPPRPTVTVRDLDGDAFDPDVPF